MIGHVAFNALFLDPGHSGGTETYLRGLLPALAQEFPNVRLTVLTTRRGAQALRRDGWGEWATVAAFRSDEGQRLRRLATEQLLVSAAARRRGADVLHSIGGTGPLRGPVAHVVTVLDVMFFHHSTMRLSSTLAMRLAVGGAARHADGLIAISAAARDDICATLGLPRESVRVVHLGAGRAPEAVTPMPAGEVRDRHGLDGRRLVLCVAALRPHKNQELLVRALEHLPQDVVVGCVGAHEPYAEEVRALAQRLGVTERVGLPGYVDDAELEGLWRQTACAAFPTRAEGFGLPVVEAMRRSVPVACSDIPVLHEVGGDVPVYFDPDRPEDAARAIVQAMAAGPHSGARDLAERFTWEAAAHGTFEAYERALRSRSAAS